MAVRVIVTGAAGALGSAVVDRFVADGDTVAGIVRTSASPPGTGPVAEFACPDLANPVQARDALTAAAEWLGGVDALVHVAGAFAFATIANTEVEAWEALHRANTLSTLVTVRAAMPLMTDGGAIVAVGAASAQPAGAGMGAYAASKAGVARLIEALAAELGPRRIRANAVLPGTIDTPANRADMPDADPAGWTSPGGIADAIHFLASARSRAINGASVPVTNAG